MHLATKASHVTETLQDVNSTLRENDVSTLFIYFNTYLETDIHILEGQYYVAPSL